ncbi:MAG: hypothetical protein GC149_13545 [Gammaproteobacteria bacterium]|nr:hypothetical protein [Gammaproteobacteria bacterium]
MNTLKMTALLSAVLFTGSVYAGARGITHPNLRAAYQDCNQAMRHIDRAYAHNANHGAFGGHAARAKQLLAEARHELEAADAFRNMHMPR